MPGVTIGAHYVDIGNGSHLIVAGPSAAAVEPVVNLVAEVADPEIYAAIELRR
jgi:hypothetical protein